MRKLILGFSLFGTMFLFFTSTSSVKADSIYRIEVIQCSGGGSVYRCRFDGSQACLVSGQLHCDEVGGIG